MSDQPARERDYELAFYRANEACSVREAEIARLQAQLAADTPTTRVVADIEALLEAHAGVNITADWQGSPDPSNPRNIRRVCKCGDLIGQVPYPQKGRFRLGGDPFDAPHRAHVAAAIRAAMTPAPTARVAPVRAQLAARRDESEPTEESHDYAD